MEVFRGDRRGAAAATTIIFRGDGATSARPRVLPRAVVVGVVAVEIGRSRAVGLVAQRFDAVTERLLAHGCRGLAQKVLDIGHFQG